MTDPLRILLVNPPFSYFPGMGEAAQNYTRPPLGIAYLAAYLREHAGVPHVLSLLDCEVGFIRSPEAAVRAILRQRPDVIGLSVVTGTATQAGAVATMLRRERPELLIVAGGPHATALPEEPLPGVDVKVIGEGEITLTELIRAYREGNLDTPVDGAVRFQDGQVIWRGPDRPLIEPLDRVPPPARDLMDGFDYFHSFPYPNVTRFTTMFSSRGCPYACTFCGNETLWHRRVRNHSLDRVREELILLRRNGYDLIFFDDDTFTVDRERVLAICDLVREEHPRLQWIVHLRADLADRELLAAMRGAGCVEAQVGVESGDEHVLTGMNKHLALDRIRQTFRHLREVGINSWATFVLGAEGETEESIRRSIAFARELDPTYCSFIVVLPFPGTRIFDRYREAGYITTYDWSAYSWHGRPVIRLPGLDEDALEKWRRRAYLGFYLRPRILFRLFLHVLRALSVREMLRNARAWYVVAFPRRS